MNLNFYQILGVSPTAGKGEIKAAFKKLAVALHPDKNPGNAVAEEQFKQINAAYQVLSNDQRRAAYDLKLYYAANPTLAAYPEYQEESTSAEPPASRPDYRPPPSGGRPRYGARVEFDPAYVRRMYTLLGALFVAFAIGAAFFYDFINHWNAERLYQEGLQEGQSYAAMLKFSEAIGFDKQYWQAYYQRGKLRIDILGDYRHAYYDFNAAIRNADTLTAPLYYNRGLCSFQMGKNDQALGDMDEAVRLDARNGGAYYVRSLLYLRARDTTRACQDWQTAAQLGVTFPEDSLQVYCR